MQNGNISIDRLIDIVRGGGTVKTGVDIHNGAGLLLLESNVNVNNIKILETIKENGISSVPIDPQKAGGLWDKDGAQISVKPQAKDTHVDSSTGDSSSCNVIGKIKAINALKKVAARKYQEAKKCIKRVIDDIKATGGEFDYGTVEKTVNDLFDFLTENENSFAYLTREIFAYDDYLYNHAINVCTIGTAILNRFNEYFGHAVNGYLVSVSSGNFPKSADSASAPFVYYQREELHDMALGFFLHDVGKVLVPQEILNKKSKLTGKEFEIVKTHTFGKGVEILERNRLSNPFIRNIVKYHHSALFEDEPNCYPQDKASAEVPPYVKVCKLADIYDAMTSKRSYKEALNPIGVVTDVFRKYAEKDPMLQFILHSFVKSVGIYPPGSIARLVNGQLVYVMDGDGPIVLPFTDTHGTTLTKKSDPINLGNGQPEGSEFRIDRRVALMSPIEAYNLLPSYLRESLQ